MNGLLSASPGSGDTGSNLSVRQGATVTPLSKALSQNTAYVFPTELKAVSYVKIYSQGATTDFLSVSHYGPCPDVPDQHNLPGFTPYVGGTQMLDDFDLPIAGSPANGQKAMMFQTSAGNSIALGTTSTSPDGTTSPQIVSNDVALPGQAATNPGAVASGPPTKQHPWLTDFVAGHGVDQIPYGLYDYTDPTGTVHPAHTYSDKRVKKPRVDVKLSTNTTAPYLLSVAVPGLVPTQYPDSGMEFSLIASGGNDGLRNRTKWGLGVDAENYTDLKIRTSPTLPAMGTGDQTARVFPLYDNTVFNTSAIDYDPVTGAAYVKVDGVKVFLDDQGRLTSSGGGGGGGTGSPVVFSAYDLPSLVGGAVAPSANAFVQWDGGIEIDHGGWVTAGTDPAGSNMKIPVTGTYGISLQLKLAQPLAGAGLVAWVTVLINGAQRYIMEHDVSNLTNSILLFEKTIDFVAGDAVRFKVHNFTLSNIDVAGGHIDLWLIQSQPSTFSVFISTPTYSSIASGASVNMWTSASWDVLNSYDPQGHLSTPSNGIFSLPAGFYAVTWECYYSNVITDLDFEVALVRTDLGFFPQMLRERYNETHPIAFDYKHLSDQDIIDATNAPHPMSMRVTNESADPLTHFSIDVCLTYLGPLT